MRELISTNYNSDEYTDENVLYRNEMIDTVSLSNGLTYLYGKDSALFPLLTLTSGQGGITGIKPKALNDTQYTWNVMGRQKNTSIIKSLSNTNVTKPGLGYTAFEAIFKDDWFKRFYGATTPDKSHQVRVQGTPKALGNGLYLYRLMLNSADPDEYISLDNFQDGLAWVMSAPSVAASKSDGTSSNSVTPGKWTNQFGYHRFSKNIAGNISNKVTNIEFKLEGKSGTTKMWMPEEMKQFEIHKRQMLEEELWNGKYNRDKYGVIHLKDDDTGEMIPKGAGIKEILKTTGQYDTYSSLTLTKLDTILRSMFTNRVDYAPMELVVYGGSGAMDEANRAMKTDALNSSYYDKLGAEEVRSGGMYLSYGKYFNQYKTIDGHTVTFKYSKLFDQGSLAEMDRLNGRVHNNLPYESYNMVILDQSMNDDGERNIQIVGEKGRETITGIYKGMSPLPGAWGAITSNLLSTTKDEASYQIFTSQGITLKNYTTSYFLEFLKD